MDGGLLARAATGDADAQAEMVQASLQMILDGAVTYPEGVRAAEWWARLAAVHGRPKDRMSLAGVLMYAAQVAVDEGDESRSILYQAEAFSVLNDLADADDELAEHAAMMIQCAADVLAPEVTTLAADLDRINQAIEGAAEEGFN